MTPLSGLIDITLPDTVSAMESIHVLRGNLYQAVSATLTYLVGMCCDLADALGDLARTMQGELHNLPSPQAISDITFGADHE